MRLINNIKFAVQHSTKKQRLIGAGVALFIITVIAGFNEKLYTLDKCKATVTRYVTAEFSDTYPSTCTDMDGNPYMCMETDYWSEQVSRKHVAVTIDGEPSTMSFQGEGTVTYGAVYPPMPSYDQSARRHPDFDRFQQHTNSRMYAYVSSEWHNDSDVISKGISYNPRCLETLTKVVTVKSWYAFNYGVGL